MNHHSREARTISLIADRALGRGRRETRRSYSGLHACQVEVHRPRDEAEAAKALARAQALGRKVTIAGAGLSFDAQAMGPDVVITTSDLDHIEVCDAETGSPYLRVGPGARWRNVLRATAAHGLLTPIMVSSGAITTAGTVATNALSRFSPVLGKEGKWVRALRLLLPDGRVIRASRDRHPELFFGAVGGLGLVGIITEIEYDLVRVGAAPCVRSWVERRPTLEGLDRALRVEPRSGASAETVYAVVAPRGDELRVLLTRSRYVAGGKKRPMLPHRPASALRVPLELALHNIKGAGERMWNFAYDHYVDEDQPYVDDLEGYTFFMDGNLQARDAARRWGLPFQTVQQTFILPSDGPDGRLADFVTRCHGYVRATDLDLAMFDLLHLPADEPFALSSTRGGAGFAVTLTFSVRPDRDELDRIAELLSMVSGQVRAEGGRVHLTKNVFARSEDIEAMYAEGIASLAKLRRRHDPEGMLTSDFTSRLFPSLNAA